METSLVIPKNILDLCETRDRAIQLFEQATKLCEDARQVLEECGEYLSPYDAKPRTSVDDYIKELDRHLWRFAFDKTGLLQYMDAQAKKEFESALEKKPPAFTVETIKSTLLSTAQQAEQMFARGLVNVFHRLSKDHKTNTSSPFKVNNKAVLTCMVQSNWSGGLTVAYNRHASEQLNDIDRVIQTLDGKKHHPRAFETGLNVSLAKMEVYEDDYYRCKGFKNGNLHIEFKRQDLLDKANKIIGAYYEGNVLC